MRYFKETAINFETYSILKIENEEISIFFMRLKENLRKNIKINL